MIGNPRRSRTGQDRLGRLGQAGAIGQLAGRALKPLQVSPGDAKTYHLMGRVLDRMCLPDEAQEMYRRGREIGGM